MTITAQRAFDVYHMNKRGEKPEKLSAEEGETEARPEFTDGVGDEDESRFDRRRKNKSRKKHNNDRRPKERREGNPGENQEGHSHAHHNHHSDKPQRVPQEK